MRTTFTVVSRLVCRPMVAVLAIGIAGAAPVRGPSAKTLTEYRIKAAYLYNFTKFISWPPTAFESSREPLVIALVDGDPAAARAIEDTLRQKEAPGGRVIEVRHFETLEGAFDHAQIVFVLRGGGFTADAAKAAARGRAVLLIGEEDGFAERGGAINFVVSSDVVRFEINPQRAEAAGLRVSGSLAAVARLVRDRTD